MMCGFPLPNSSAAVGCWSLIKDNKTCSCKVHIFIGMQCTAPFQQSLLHSFIGGWTLHSQSNYSPLRQFAWALWSILLLPWPVTVTVSINNEAQWGNSFFPAWFHTSKNRNTFAAGQDLHSDFEVPGFFERSWRSKLQLVCIVIGSWKTLECYERLCCMFGKCFSLRDTWDTKLECPNADSADQRHVDSW